MKVTREAARRFFVARQLLAPARSLKGPKGVLEVFGRLGSIQYDPLSVAGRNHDLVLHARVADYDPAWCDRLFQRREIFEAFNKGLSFVPTSEFPWFRARLSRNPAQLLAENREVADAVLERIRKEGPLSALDFERRSGSTVDWFGIPTNVVREVLEALAATDVLGLAKRDGNRRYYDLLERLLPADVLAQEVTLHEQLRHKMLSRYRAHGLLGFGGGGDIFGGLGPAKPDPDRGLPGRTALREELVADGELVPVEIEGVRGKRLVLREEVELLEAPPEPPPSVAFLPPFDPVVWDRPFLGSVFEFDYVGAFHPAGQAALGVVRAADPLPRPPRRAHRAADRARRRLRPRARRLVGGRLPATRGWVRRRHARGAPRVLGLRPPYPDRVAGAPRPGETAVPQRPLTA